MTTTGNFAFVNSSHLNKFVSSLRGLKALINKYFPDLSKMALRSGTSGGNELKVDPDNGIFVEMEGIMEVR